MAAMAGACVLLPARAALQQQQRSSSSRPSLGSAFLGGRQQQWAGQRAALEASSSSSGTPQRRVATMAAKGEPAVGNVRGCEALVGAADAWPSFPSREAGTLSNNVPRCHAVTGMIKLALPAGKANPAPPVGPALGAKVRTRCGGLAKPCSTAPPFCCYNASARRCKLCARRTFTSTPCRIMRLLLLRCLL